MKEHQPAHSGWILTATILTSGLGFFMGSAVNVALPTIQGYWDLTLSLVQWIANGYALTLSAFILLSGSLGDLFGVRRVFNAGIIIFAGAAALCGLAPTPGALVAARAIQGLGAAIMVPGSLAIINRLYPEAVRGRVIGLWAGISGAIAALGPLFGGLLAEVSWRLLFFFVLPLGIGASIITSRFVPTLRDEQPAGVDWAGAGTVLLALGGLSYGLVRIPEVGVTPVTGGAIILGLISSLLFLLAERRASYPILPFAMFNRTVTVANIATLLLYFAFQGIFFLLSFLFQQLFGYSASFTGLAFLPATAMIALFAAPSGTLTDRWGPRFQLIAGPTLLAGAMGLMVTGAQNASFYTYWLPVILLFGGGMVLVVPAITKAALLVEERYSGAASGFNNAAARTAGLLAITLLGGALNFSYQSLLPEALPAALSESARSQILDDAGRLLSSPLPSSLAGALEASVIEARRLAFAASSRIALSIAAGAALLSTLIILLFLPRRPSRD